MKVRNRDGNIDGFIVCEDVEARHGAMVFDNP